MIKLVVAVVVLIGMLLSIVLFLIAIEQWKDRSFFDPHFRWLKFVAIAFFLFGLLVVGLCLAGIVFITS